MNALVRDLFPPVASRTAPRALIVGAGVIGLCVARALLAERWRVAVIDAAEPGRGASWAAAGMLAPTLEHAEALLAGRPASDAERAFADLSLEMWPSLARALERESGRHVGLRREGSLGVAASRAGLEALAGAISATAASERAGRVRLLTARAVRTLAPALGASVSGAVFAPSDVQVDNRAVLTALIAGVSRAGGVVRGGQTLTDVEPGAPARAHLMFDGADVTVEADEVVICAGFQAARLARWPVLGAIGPAKGQMLALDGAGVELGHVVRSSGVYLVPKDDGRLLIGASVEPGGADDVLDEDILEGLRARAIQIAPAAAAAARLDAWAGVRPAVRRPDGGSGPMLGRLEEGVSAFVGHYRNGVLLAPATADTAARLLARGEMSAAASAFAPPVLAPSSSAGRD